MEERGVIVEPRVGLAKANPATRSRDCGDFGQDAVGFSRSRVEPSSHWSGSYTKSAFDHECSQVRESAVYRPWFA